MDEDEESQPPFRWNRQAVVMLFFFMFAMAIPLMGVVWFLRGYLAPHPAPPLPAIAARKGMDTSALEKGLERMSDEEFSAEVKLGVENSLELHVDPDEMAARGARIAEIAEEAGGSALDVSEAGAKSRRIMVRVPVSRLELLTRAIRGDRVDFSAIPAGTETDLLEVRLKAP